MVLTIQAGAKAYQHIRKKGLSPEHISAIYGASGAAKWISIYGLDRAVFSEWLHQSSQPIDLFGTSVGAFKLAAAAQRDPAQTLLALVEAYITQDYENDQSEGQVVRETKKLLDVLLSEQGIEEVLNNQRLRFHCGSVKCLGGLASSAPTPQKLAMVKAFFQALAGRPYLRHSLERAIFYAGGDGGSMTGCDEFPTESVALSKENIRAAILSSGSIPVMMSEVDNIAGAAKGVYRDGGLLDYHALPSNISTNDNGLVLYPHFYPHLKECWFDKFFPWRKASAEQLENVVLISPSQTFIDSLPGGRIPERQDFTRFHGRNQQRLQRWNEVKQRSLELGEAFLTLSHSGDIAGTVTLID